MRKSQIFLGAIAALSMGFYSCSSEDAPNAGGNVSQKGDKYIAVNIRTSGMTGTRAAGEGFVEGTDAEGTVTTANTRFYFYDGNGKAFTMENNGNINASEGGVISNMVQPAAVNPGNTDGNKPEGTAVLILGTPTKDFQGMLPAKAICVVGLDEAGFTALQGQDLSNVATTLSAYDNNGFIMTTSNWKGAGDNGAVNIADKVKETQADAEGDPADFYLDRLAVRVEFKESTTNTNDNKWMFPSLNSEGDAAIYKIYKDGSQVEVGLNVVIDNWQLVNTANNSYLVKQLPATDPWANWSDATYHRSYWAESPATASLTNPSFDITSANGWSAMGIKNYTNEYTKGTQSEIDLTKRGATTTAVAIKAHVEYSDGTAADIVRWAGNYYTYGDFINLVVSSYNSESTTTEAATTADVKLVDEGTTYNSFKVQVKGNDYKYKAIEHWNNGVTSFYMNIANEQDMYGVVRNHIYQYEIEKVVGLGVPGNGDGPEPQKTYVAARLNVLNWKLVAKKVTLE